MSRFGPGVEGTLGTAAKQTIILARHPLASVAGVISTVGVAVAYFFAARLSLALLEPVDGVAVFWPAAGVASGILIALGTAARWPVVVAVMAATIAANLLGDRNIWSSVFFAVANAGDAVIVAGLIHRFCGSPFELNELRRVLALFAATVAGTSLSGIAGTAGFVLFHGSTASPPVIWLHWFSSDAIGIIAVAPLAIGLASLARNLPPRREIAEGVLALAVVASYAPCWFSCPMSPGPRSWRSARSAHFCSGSQLAFVQRLPRLPRSSLRSRLSGRQSSQSAFSGTCTCRSKSVCWGPKLPSWRSHWAPWFLRPCLASGGCTKGPITGGAAGRQSYSLRLGRVCRRNTI